MFFHITRRFCDYFIGFNFRKPKLKFRVGVSLRSEAHRHEDGDEEDRAVFAEVFGIDEVIVGYAGGELLHEGIQRGMGSIA